MKEINGFLSLYSAHWSAQGRGRSSVFFCKKKQHQRSNNL